MLELVQTIHFKQCSQVVLTEKVIFEEKSEGNVSAATWEKAFQMEGTANAKM